VRISFVKNGRPIKQRGIWHVSSIVLQENMSPAVTEIAYVCTERKKILANGAV